MAATDATPPPPSTVRTPPTPRLGWEDDYQPYAPRKSARLSARQSSRRAQTPPPPSSTSRPSLTVDEMTSPPSSPPTARKRDRPNGFSSGSGRRVSGALTDRATSSAAEALGLSPPEKKASESLQVQTTLRGDGMLPTPSKTPKKLRTQDAANINAVARNLFNRPSPADDAMPTPKRNGRKTSGLTLESFTVHDDLPPIQIYNDPQDRVPEKDMTEENPFYHPQAAQASEPVKQSNKRKTIQIPGEGEVPLEEAEKREDGMVYVFRGKKIFRKFADADEDGSVDAEPEDAAELAEESSDIYKPLTRSSIKPRLLFPPNPTKPSEDDEEAVTDIEDEAREISTPTKHTHRAAATPKAAKFAPVSPPTTARTRNGRRAERTASPIPMPSLGSSPETTDAPRRAPRRGPKTSPFDEWQRRKPAASSDKKREGDELERESGAASKRLRGSV